MWLSKLFQKKKTEQVFTKIYRENYWAAAETASGPGSTLQYTKALREQLPILLHSLSAKKLLDVPCGDFHWMQHTNLNGIEYLGGDIVQELIEKNRRLFPDYRFQKIDIITDPLPPADVLLCRDCFIHLSNRQVAEAIRNIKKSSITYLLTNTYPTAAVNTDIQSGQWRMLNFLKPPFSFPPPLTMLPDYIESYPVRFLALWKVNTLPA